MSAQDKSVYELLLEDKLAEVTANLSAAEARVVEANNQASRFKRIVEEMWAMFYGQNLRLENWHKNGDLEPIDNFFEDNDWDYEQQPGGSHE